jgi:hypothetical protein
MKVRAFLWSGAFKGLHDTQHNDNQNNDIQYNGTQHLGLVCDTQHN